jgi:hypothetical protein
MSEPTNCPTCNHDHSVIRLGGNQGAIILTHNGEIEVRFPTEELLPESEIYLMMKIMLDALASHGTLTRKTDG